jgi:hypothetical protein
MSILIPNKIMANASSYSQINIINDINSSTNTGNNSSNSTTDIRIETNGEVKEYHGTGNQNVTLESGNNSVKVINKTDSNSQSSPESLSNKNTPNVTPTLTPSLKSTLTPTPTPAINTLQNLIKKSGTNNLSDFIKYIQAEYFKIFKLLFHKSSK